MHEKFRLVGVSHSTAPIEVREAVSFTLEETGRFLKMAREILGVEEMLVISTCNRTELYYSYDQDLTESMVSLIVTFKSLTDKSKIAGCFRQMQGLAAIEHLYEVALGLDAKVLGDIQISNQVKRAYQVSADEQMAGPLLHRLLHSVFFANKRVVQETPFRDGAASTSYASVEIINRFIKNFKSAKILILGLGEIGEDVAGNLVGVKADITVANRTKEKAEDIAAQFNYRVVAFTDAIQNLTAYDVIISSVAAPQAIISTENFKSESLSHKLLIDLSIPRSIDPQLENQSGVVLYNIDQIEERTTEIQQKRAESIPAVRKILYETVQELLEWSTEMEVSPTIKKLKQALEDIRQEELARYVKKADAAQLALIDQATKNILQKVIKLPVLHLKAACKRGEAETLVEVLNDLFDLEKDTTAAQSE